MKNLKKNRKKNYWWIISFLLPVVIMLMIYATLDIWPFGRKTVLTIDLNRQYISFFSYLREILLGKKEFFYSFSKVFGGNMAGLNAYYLMSPLNILLLFFTTEGLPLGIELITLLKIGFCGLTFYLCVIRNGSWKGLIFSTSYALMAYNIVYQQNIMWLDGVILLPVIVLGICWIIEKKAPFLYLFSLAAAILINYYIGFMLCIFSVLFFGFMYFFREKDKKRELLIILRFGYASLLGGGLGMWLLLPVLKSLEGGKAKFDLSWITLEKVFPMRDFISKFYVGSFDYNQIKTGHAYEWFNLPNIYCGLFILMLAGLFFLNKKIEARKKIGAMLMLLILFLSFYLKGPNMIWHGFNEPIWFPFRFSFVFSFFILYIAWESFCRFDGISNRYMGRCMLVILGALIAGALITWDRPYDFIKPEIYILSISIAMLFGVVYLIYCKKKKHIFAVMLLCMCCGELFINGVCSLRIYAYSDYDEWVEYIAETEPVINYIKAEDKSFYRMEKNFYRSQNDPMLFGYHGLSHYSSSEMQQIKVFMRNLGFTTYYRFWSIYGRGNTYATDCLLGVKYICSKTKMDEPYQLIKTIGDIQIYENPYAFSIGFMADESVLSGNPKGGQKFQFQNDLWKVLENDIRSEIFKSEKVKDIKLVNMEAVEEHSGLYQKINPESSGKLIYSFVAESEAPVFVWLGTETEKNMPRAEIKVNGRSLGKYFDSFQYDIIRLGEFEKGETVEVEVIAADNALSLTDAWIYYQDMEVSEEYYQELMKGQLKITQASETMLAGTVNNHTGKKYMMFTIPKEEGWHVYVDGKEKPAETAMGIFMAVKVPEGVHQVELKFIAPGLKAGVCISGISGVLVIVWIIIKKCGFLHAYENVDA